MVSNFFGELTVFFMLESLLKKALNVVKDYSQQLMTVWVLLGCSLQKQSKDIIMQQKNNINILLKNKKSPA